MARRMAVIGLFAVLVLIPAAALAQSAQPGSGVVKVAAMGDIMLGTEGSLPDDEGKGSFAAVKPYLEGRDVIFGNQEGVLADEGSCVKTSPTAYCFRTPTAYAKYYKNAGFNMLSIANNHVGDYGEAAKKTTMATLKELGIGFSGPPGTVARLEVDGIKVVMIAFYSGSGSNPLSNIPQAKSLVKKLTRTDDLVIVSFHGGAEGAKAAHLQPGGENFMGEYRGDVMGFSRAVVDAGADLVIGHGPHVPRAMEIYQDRLIAYSLGNFCTGKRINVKGISGFAPLLQVDLDQTGRPVGGRIVGFTQDYGAHPKHDPKNQAARLIYQLGREDLPKSTAVAEDGSLIVPPAAR